MNDFQSEMDTSPVPKYFNFIKVNLFPEAYFVLKIP